MAKLKDFTIKTKACDGSIHTLKYEVIVDTSGSFRVRFDSATENKLKDLGANLGNHVWSQRHGARKEYFEADNLAGTMGKVKEMWNKLYSRKLISSEIHIRYQVRTEGNFCFTTDGTPIPHLMLESFGKPDKERGWSMGYRKSSWDLKSASLDLRTWLVVVELWQDSTGKSEVIRDATDDDVLDNKNMEFLKACNSPCKDGRMTIATDESVQFFVSMYMSLWNMMAKIRILYDDEEAFESKLHSGNLKLLTT